MSNQHELDDWISTILFVGAIICLLIFWISWQDDVKRERCESRHGEYVHVSRGSICVQPGSVIKT